MIQFIFIVDVLQVTEKEAKNTNMTNEDNCMGTNRRTFCIFGILLLLVVIVITAIALGLTLGHKDSKR